MKTPAIGLHLRLFLFLVASLLIAAGLALLLVPITVPVMEVLR